MGQNDNFQAVIPLAGCSFKVLRLACQVIMKINKKYARERILLPGACVGFIAHVGFPDHEIIIVMTMYNQGCY